MEDRESGNGSVKEMLGHQKGSRYLFSLPLACRRISGGGVKQGRAEDFRIGVALK